MSYDVLGGIGGDALEIFESEHAEREQAPVSEPEEELVEEDDEPEFEIRPHLSYLDNHPIRPLSAAHMTFEITE